jgi:mannose-1-phosphate guanylyltransferase
MKLNNLLFLLQTGNFLAAKGAEASAGSAVISRITAVLLVGGKGTRLRPITYRVPKALVRIRGRPFIHYLLSQLSGLGIRNCILLTGYKHGMIRDYCGSGSRWGLKIAYLRERKPLGTGGALLNAKGKIKTTALVVNSDTYSDFDIGEFLEFHKKRRALATIFAIHGSLAGKGAIKADKSGRVARFSEKQKSGSGLFNAGVYIIEPEALELLHRKIWDRKKRKFSLEEEGFPALMASRRLYAYKGKGRFLDIGTFESLAKARKFDFKKRC